MQAPGSGSGGTEDHDSNQGGASSEHAYHAEGAYKGAVSRVVQIADGPWPFGEIVLVISRTIMQLHELRWVDPDRDRLHSMFSHFLEDLALLLRTMRRFATLLPPMSLLGKGG